MDVGDVREYLDGGSPIASVRVRCIRSEQLLTCNPGSNLGVLTLEENAAKNGSFDPREKDLYLEWWRTKNDSSDSF